MTNSIFVDWTAPQKRDELPRLHSIPLVKAEEVQKGHQFSALTASVCCIALQCARISDGSYGSKREKLTTTSPPESGHPTAL
jgi:hypothetical protein